jgi:hypothetical protein
MLYTNWDPTSSHRFGITLACHGNGSNYQTDPTGGGSFYTGSYIVPNNGAVIGNAPVLATTHTYTIFWRPNYYHYEGPHSTTARMPWIRATRTSRTSSSRMWAGRATTTS